MADAKLSILISADTGQAQAGLNNLNNAVDKTAQNLNNLPATTGGLTTAFQKLENRSSTARFAVQNLGDTIRDIPFAAVNPAILTTRLDHVVASFSQLKLEAGSTKGALQLLGSSISGGGGLLIAFNIISTAIALFAGKLFGSRDAAKETSDALKQLSENVSNQAAKLTSLVGIIENTNSKYGEKQKALQAINQEYKDYLSNLGIEKVTTENLASAYEKIVDSLLRQAVVKGLQDEISKAVNDTAAQIIKLQEADEKKNLEQGKSVVLSKEEIESNNQKIASYKKVETGLLGLQKPIQDGILAQTQSNLTTKASVNDIGSLSERVDDLKAKLLLQLQPLLQVTKSFGDLNIKLDSSKSKTDDLKKSLQFDPSVLEKLLNRKTLEGPNISLNISDLENVQKNISSIEEQISNISKIRSSVGVNLQPEIDKLNEELKLYKQIAAAIPATVPLTLKESERFSDNVAIAQEIENALKDLPPVNIPVEVKAKLSPKQFADYLKDLDSAFKNLQNVSRQALSGFLETIGNSLGDIISGKNPFQAIFQFIGDTIQQFGKAIIELGIIKKGLDTVLKNILTLPAAAILAIGIGAIAIGEVVKNLGNSLPGRAEGGEVIQGQPYIVGEKGREIFVPQKSGFIISNDIFKILSKTFDMSGLQQQSNQQSFSLQPANLNSFGNANLSTIRQGSITSVRVSVSGRLAGRDILLSNKRETRNNNRNV